MTSKRPFINNSWMIFSKQVQIKKGQFTLISLIGPWLLSYWSQRAMTALLALGAGHGDTGYLSHYTVYREGAGQKCPWLVHIPPNVRTWIEFCDLKINKAWALHSGSLWIGKEMELQRLSWDRYWYSYLQGTEVPWREGCQLATQASQHSFFWLDPERWVRAS